MDARAQAIEGRQLIEDAILLCLKEHHDGLYNNELARMLSLESAHEGKQSNYLTYSLLGGMMDDGRIVKGKRGNRTYYKAAP